MTTDAPQMLTRFFQRSPDRARAKQLYGAIVTAARAPVLYAELGLEDSPAGRFEAVVLHLFLVMERLRAGGAPLEAIARDLVDTFVEDMDDNLREMGVGDLSVPKKVKKAAAAFYERAALYRPVLDQNDDAALAAAIAQSLPAAPGRDLDSSAIAAHVMKTMAALAHHTDGDLAAGVVTLPVLSRSR
jgi:cytochrome b pre-mRNA-processing protein 3